MAIIVRRGAHNELGALSGRGKHRGVAGLHQLCLALSGPVPNLCHGPQNGLFAFIRSQRLQALLRGQLDVNAEPVCQQPQPLHQLRRCAGDGFGMDIPVEAILLSQDPQALDHPFGGVIRASQHAGGEEQPLDIVAAVKADGQLRQLPWCEGRPAGIVAAPVDAVLAVEHAAVGHQHLQQGDASPVGGEAVAAAGDRGGGVADHPRPGAAPDAAGGAGCIVFGGVRQDGQLIQQLHAVTPCGGAAGGDPAGR